MRLSAYVMTHKAPLVFLLLFLFFFLPILSCDGGSEPPLCASALTVPRKSNHMPEMFDSLGVGYIPL